MNLTHSADPIRADAVVTESGRTAIQYVAVDYTVPSESFTDTSFTFKVRKSAVPAETDPEEIAFERYSEGAWRTQNARLVSESDSAYRFRVITNGYSQFVITGPATAEGDGCELFGFDYGSFIVCWYWWVLLAVLGLVLASYHLWQRGLLASSSSRNQNDAGGDDDD